MGRWRFVWASGLIVGAAGVVMGSCGSSSSGAGGQFCNDWAAAFCHKLYACTPADQRGADFLGGPSESQCTQGWAATCANPPSGGQVFDVNCSGGVHVNTAAKTACLNELSTISCDEFSSPNYSSVCTQVCPASTGGAGTSGGAGTGGGGTGGSGGTAVAGTTGTGGTGSGTSACGMVEPCGGAVAGSWSFTSECLDKSFLNPSVQQVFYCPDAQVTATQVNISGNGTFGTDFSYTITQNVTAAITFTIPTTCTNGLSCTAYGANMATALADTSIACSGNGPCTCSQGATSSNTDSGTYTVAGSNLNLASSTGLQGSLGYCVQGSTIHFVTVDPTMHTGPGGQATIVKDIVGTMALGR